MGMFRPPYLQPGDKIAVVSPAGYIEASFLETSGDLLKSWGLEPVFGRHAASRHNYFAGTDEERRQDMQWALDAEDIRAILCSRGGYGSMRIVEQLDYSIFQGNPKWLVGCSDITVFHSKLNTLGIESLHAPMPKSYGTTTPASLEQLRDFLFGDIPSYHVPAHPLNREGIVRAELTGGNLSLLHCLHATNLACHHQSPILFIEDVGENLYAIDRMMQSLKLSGKFEKLQGMIIGSFSEMKGQNFGKNAYEIIREAVEEYAFPIGFGFPAGHTPNNYPLIMGSTTELEVTKEGCEIKFL